MIGYIKAVIFFEGLTATSGRNLAPIQPHSPPHRLATITDGVAGWFPGVPPPPAVDLRVGELFPGGRWKHRTNSPSTTSTLMVEIAATTKKSMAVPERRCMRRWSSGLRVVKLAEKRCTTKPPIHAQWNEGGSVEEGAFLDEVFVTINGQRQYLWRAVDQDGDLIDILVQPRRDGRAARRFFRRLLKSQRQEPVRLVTDKLGSYRVAHRDLMPLVTHDTRRYANNRAEVSHQPTRQRERQMRGFTSSDHAQRFLHVHGVIQNLFRVGRHLSQGGSSSDVASTVVHRVGPGDGSLILGSTRLILARTR